MELRKRSRKPALDTLAVHAGRTDFFDLGVHAPPIDLSTTYPFGDLQQATASLETLVGGGADAPNAVYARLHNPTVARLERAVADLEGAESAVAFSSGMAAVTATLLAAAQRGSHVVAVRPLYGTTDHLLASGLLGLKISWTQQDGVAASIRPDTALVVIETPGNPTLQLVDIESVVRQAGSVPVLVDSTFATPILQRPLSLGARFSLHSATKFIGGHGDVVAGIVAASEADAAALRRVRVATGALLHPLAAYLLHRSIPTLPLRVENAQRTAVEIANRLAGHEAIRNVYFPTLPNCDPRRLIGRQMSGPGSIVSFELSGDFDHDNEARIKQVSAFFKRLELITPAVSLGSTDTLIQHPAGLTHHVLDEDSRAAGGITNALIRVSIGLEDVEDIWADLSAGLTAAARFHTDRTVAAGR